jgi:hypothetical protein
MDKHGLRVPRSLQHHSRCAEAVRLKDVVCAHWAHVAVLAYGTRSCSELKVITHRTWSKNPCNDWFAAAGAATRPPELADSQAIACGEQRPAG